MRFWRKLIAAAALPLLLTGCLWGPGKFTSELALRKNGAFVLDYRGEIMLQLPDDPDRGFAEQPWSEKMAHCYTNGTTSNYPGAFMSTVVTPGDSVAKPRKTEPPQRRTCTVQELSDLRSEHDKAAAERAKRKREKSDQMAALLGVPGSDDESNRRFAANLMKYRGWRSAIYKGKGIFEVDYHFEGRVGQDYAFPMMPDADFIVPFINLRHRSDGSVMVTAPAFTGKTGPLGARAKMLGLPDKDERPPSRAEGRFTIVTDGEILTNNSEDGPVPHPSGRQVHWDVGPGSDKVPEMLVRL